jgi:hypothetical protein
MDSTLFNKIANSEIAHYSSFALWDDHDITDVDILYASVHRLTSTKVIVGLNPSESGILGRFRNFHSNYSGCKDHYLHAAFQSGSATFTGAYMTDLVSENRSKREKGVKPDERSLRRLVAELEFVEFFAAESPVIVALGTKVYKALAEGEGGRLFRHVTIERISHQNRFGLRKDDFVMEVRDLSQRIDRKSPP